jgi:hypothetical protein
MRHGLAVCALLLLVAFPTLAARRRAVSPGQPSRCSFTSGPLVLDAFTDTLAKDDQYLYWIDSFEGQVFRTPLDGSGEPVELARIGEEWLVLSMTVDATNVYISAVPFTIIFAPVPGEIMTFPKTGGTPVTLVAGINMPWTVETDATHVYWVSSGTFDFSEETITNDGKIERALKNGSGREALVENLSTPLDLALDGDVLYYGETGLADGDPTVGVYRIAKSGGTVTTINNNTAAAELDLTADSVVFWGGNEQTENGLFRVRKTGSGVTVLVSDDLLFSGPRVIDGRAYYATSDDDSDLIRWVSIDTPGPPVTVVAAYVSADFELDACGVIYVDVMDSQIWRKPR